MQRAGVYGLEIGMGRLDVAVNTDPRESDLHTVDRTTFSNAAGVPIRWVDPGTGFDRESVDGRAAEMSVPILLLVAVLLFVEVAVARRQAH